MRTLKHNIPPGTVILALCPTCKKGVAGISADIIDRDMVYEIGGLWLDGCELKKMSAEEYRNSDIKFECECGKTKNLF
jgi:Zn-finger nucleic acid-binding protein